MKAKKNAKRAKRTAGAPTKTDFVRGLPGIPASEVVAKAKERGIALSPAFVYAIRSNDKRRSAKRSPSSRGAASAGPVRAGAGSIEERFATLAIELGMNRAQAVLDQVRGRVKTLLGRG